MSAGLVGDVLWDVRRLVRAKPSLRHVLWALLTNRGVQALVLYRTSHALWKRRVPLLPLLLTRIEQFLYAVDIAYEAEIGPGVVITHGFGLVIGRDVTIEGDCCLFHGVTLGSRGLEWVGADPSEGTDGHPVVEKDVMIGAGAKVLGPVRIGQNSVIGANAVVLKDVPPDSIAVGVPAKVVGHRPRLDEQMQPVDGHVTREQRHI